MKKVTKAVFSVAGLGARFLPATKSTPKGIMVLVDRSLTQCAVYEARAARIQEFTFCGQRYDCGSKAGFLPATVAFGRVREDLGLKFSEALAEMVSMKNAAQ